MQQIYFYIDDSGVLHKNERYFVYAGYVFLDAKERNVAYVKYKSLSNKIRDSLGIKGELKSSLIKTKHKRALFNILKYEHSLGVYVNNKNVYNNIMNYKKSRHRYKDYILKMAIKEKVKQLIRMNLVDSNQFLNIKIYIDEQLTATDGYYDLEHSIFEELVNGIHNFNYNVFHEPILRAGAHITVKFLDSKNNYLIQASDVLANRFRASFVYKNHKLRRKPNHSSLHLP